MSSLRFLALFALVVGLPLAAPELPAAPAPVTGPIRADPANPHYFNYRGQPLVLVVRDTRGLP